MTAPHDYLSTACLHGEHGYCSAATKPDGRPKFPARCKWCNARCRCDCHADTGAPGTAPASTLAPQDTPAGGIGYAGSAEPLSGEPDGEPDYRRWVAPVSQWLTADVARLWLAGARVHVFAAPAVTPEWLTRSGWTATAPQETR